MTELLFNAMKQALEKPMKEDLTSLRNETRPSDAQRPLPSAVIRNRLISAGVRNLKEFGYPNVSADNLITDRVYRAFFKSMLEDNKGKGYDAEVDELLSLLTDIEKAAS